MHAHKETASDISTYHANLKTSLKEQSERLIALIKKQTEKQLGSLDEAYQLAIEKFEKGHTQGLLELLNKLKNLLKKEGKSEGGIDLECVSDYHTLQELENTIGSLKEKSEDKSQTW